MPTVLTVNREFFESPFVPAQCLFSGAAEPVRLRRIKINRSGFGAQCLQRTLLGLFTLGLGAVALLIGLRLHDLTVPCTHRAWMHWNLRRNLGALLLLIGPLAGFGVACFLGDASLLLLYFTSPWMLCGCGNLPQAVIVWLGVTPGGWATLTGLGVGLTGQAAALWWFHTRSVTLAYRSGSDEVAIQFPDALQDRYQLWRDAYLAYIADWNTTHPAAPAQW